MLRIVVGFLAGGLLAGCGAAPSTPLARAPAPKLGTPLARPETAQDLPFGKAPPPSTHLKNQPVVKGGSFASNRFQATIRAIDARNRTLTLSVGGQDRTLLVAADAFIGDDGPRNLGIPGGLQGLQPGSQVTVVTSKVGQWETINLVIVQTR